VPRVGSFGKTSFNMNGAKLWNALPSHVKSCSDIARFKYLLKKVYLDKMSGVESCDYLYY